jgi:hypothetical protein
VFSITGITGMEQLLTEVCVFSSNNEYNFLRKRNQSSVSMEGQNLKNSYETTSNTSLRQEIRRHVQDVIKEQNESQLLGGGQPIYNRKVLSPILEESGTSTNTDEKTKHSPVVLAAAGVGTLTGVGITAKIISDVANNKKEETNNSASLNRNRNRNRYSNRKIQRSHIL